MKSKKYVLKEGLFNWLLSTLVGKDNNAKIRWYAAIHTDPKLRKLSKEFEKSAEQLERQFKKREKSPDFDKEYKSKLSNILKHR